MSGSKLGGEGVKTDVWIIVILHDMLGKIVKSGPEKTVAEFN